MAQRGGPLPADGPDLPPTWINDVAEDARQGFLAEVGLTLFRKGDQASPDVFLQMSSNIAMGRYSVKVS